MTDEPNKIDLEEEIDTDPGDDVTFEDMSENLAPEMKDKTDKLKARIKELEAKNADLMDKWQRDEDKKEFIKFAKADVIAELLPVLDSFESAFKNKEAWEKVDKNWRVGVEYINSQLMTVLGNHALKVINPVGEMYNAVRDEAVETVKVDDKKDDGKILDVVQVGYELNGKEIRAPKVRVAHFE